MRKLTVTLFAAGAALAVAAPASAQYYGSRYAPQQQPSYGYAYGNGYGQNGYGQMQRLQMRVEALEHFIQRLDRADRVTSRKAQEFKREARSIEQRLRMASAYGLHPYEARDIETRLGRLEQRVSYATIQRFGRNFGPDFGRQAAAYGYPGYGAYMDNNDDHRWGGDHDRGYNGDWGRDRDDDDDDD